MRVLPLSEQATQKAIAVLRGGNTIVYPTETAYALGADPRNVDAVQKVFAIKGRGQEKPLGLVAASLEQVQALCAMSPEEEELAKKYWPAALSIVLQVRDNLSTHWLAGLAIATARSGTASIRVSASAWVRNLCLVFGFPLIATSANRSGEGEIFDPRTINRTFDRPPLPDLFIDGGALSPSPVSTIVKVENGNIRLLRQGAVRIADDSVE